MRSSSSESSLGEAPPRRNLEEGVGQPFCPPASSNHFSQPDCLDPNSDCWKKRASNKVMFVLRGYLGARNILVSIARVIMNLLNITLYYKVGRRSIDRVTRAPPPPTNQPTGHQMSRPARPICAQESMFWGKNGRWSIFGPKMHILGENWPFFGQTS